MSKVKLSLEAEEALAITKLSGLKKKLNADSWSNDMEELMKMWGEKAAGLRFMHTNAANSWKGFSNKLTILSISVTTLASTASLSTASMEDAITKNIIMYIVGSIGIIATLIQTLKKFYEAEEKAADHRAIAKQFGSYYRYMTLQMGMSREDRVSAEELSNWALKEYERLQQDAPAIGNTSITTFKNTFSPSEQAMPDICEDKFIIKIHKRNDIVVDVDVQTENIIIDLSGVNITDQVAE